MVSQRTLVRLTRMAILDAKHDKPGIRFRTPSVRCVSSVGSDSQHYNRNVILVLHAALIADISKSNRPNNHSGLI